MKETYNIYCDESCHLEHDREDAMVLGAICCPEQETRKIAEEMRDLKRRHGLSPQFEIKWTKVSPAKIDFYRNIIDYFFDNENISFRAVVIPDKSRLRHGDFQQHHDDWYYKMYFNLLKVILEPNGTYYIYVDIKDTRSIAKTNKLHDILCNSMYDFDRAIIRRIQPVHSHEVEQIQLADLFIGAVSYINRKLNTSDAKVAIVNEIRRQTGYSLTQSTLLREKKCNVFIWRPQGDER